MTIPEIPKVDFSIGIPSVDREHYDLMREIGRLLDDPEIHLDSEQFSEIISRLGQLLAEHFRSEEAIIESCGIPADDALAHHRAHRKILEQYTELQLDLMARVPLDQHNVFGMIRSWIVEHLIAYDLRLRPYVKQIVDWRSDQ